VHSCTEFNSDVSLDFASLQQSCFADLLIKALYFVPDSSVGLGQLERISLLYVLVRLDLLHLVSIFFGPEKEGHGHPSANMFVPLMELSLHQRNIFALAASMNIYLITVLYSRYEHVRS
jgi:hypothetical protein